MTLMKIKNYLSKLAQGTRNALVILAVTGFLGVAQGASISELMEKAIYSEETKGDIDAALKLYQQVLTEAKSGQALAAQAQYRVGVCYYKKKDYAGATAAFEKLAKEYPEQKELISQANKYLAKSIGLLPAPWVNGEELILDIKFPTGFKLGSAKYAMEETVVNGRKAWRTSTHLYAGVQTYSTVLMDAETFKPYSSRWKHILIDDAEATYNEEQVEIKSKVKNETKKVEAMGICFDNEQVIQLLRRLPLAKDYVTTIRCVSTLSGGMIIPVKFTVVGIETVETPKGKFECFKIELDVKQTFWYSTDEHRYLVKFEAGGITSELIDIRQRKTGEPTVYKDANVPVALTLPDQWSYHRATTPNIENSFVVHLMDPILMEDNTLAIWKETVAANENTSVKQWAEKQIADEEKIGKKDGTVRPDSWQERQVGGVNVVSCVKDLEGGKEKKVVYNAYARNKSTCLKFRFVTPANESDTMMKKYNAIISSLKWD